MLFDRKRYSDKVLKDLYKDLLLPRLIEEKMLVLLRQGKISKWFSGIGQEAIAVGVTHALHQDEYILPLHRNLGVFTCRQTPLKRLFAQWQGNKEGYTRGRDRSFHFGLPERHIIGMISHLGPQNGIADGIALAHALKKEKKVTAVFNGDGGVSEGDFHEAVNVAAVWQLPVVFVIENNGYGLSTPSQEQFRCAHLVDKAIGYGMKGVRVDGNDVLAVYHAVRSWAQQARATPHPLLLEAVTFRMRGHEEASGIKYVPKKTLETWKRKDPLIRYEKYLKKQRLLDPQEAAELRHKLQKKIDEDLAQAALGTPPDTQREEEDVYFPFRPKRVAPASQKESKKRFIDAITEGLRQSMERYPNLILMGQDIAEYGGAFKVTQGFVDLFGRERVRNTPICEAAIVGAGLGLSIQGMKAMVEMQFADFVTEGFNQIVNNLAKTHWRWGQRADVVIRMPTGAGVGAGPFHSQSNEAWFFHTPGLKIVYPSTPYAAKGLLNAAFEDPNPYLFFEHKALYRSLSGAVPDDYYTLPVGQARTVTRGEDLSIITYGMGVHWAMREAKNMPDTKIEIIDLQTLLPWDKETVQASVKKTGKALILHEDTLTGGIGAEWAAWIGEHCFTCLDAPVRRIASLDTPVPYSKTLEDHFLPQGRLAAAIRDILAF